MKKDNKNNYYNDEDKVNFEKLNNFNKFNSNSIKSAQLNNYNTRYSNSDKNYFNTILKIDENTSVLNNNINKEKKYYNSSDFKKFDRLNNFPEYNNKIDFENKENLGSETKYKSSDYGEFNKIIQTKNNEKKTKDQNKKIKVIDYGKIKENEKKLKDRVGVGKIKIVYFD